MELSNRTANYSNTTCSFSASQGHFLLITPTVLCLIAVAANTLVVCLVAFNIQLHKTINFYILNMAVSDTITALVLCFKYANLYFYCFYNSVKLFTPNDTKCRIENYFTKLCPLVSLLTMLVISVDRYRAVSKPLTLIGTSRTKLIGSIALTWILPGAFNIYTAMLLKYSTPNGQCDTFGKYSNALPFQIVSTTVPVLTFATAFFLNFKIIKTLKKTTVEMPNVQANERQKRLKAIRSAVLMVRCLLVLFFVCWFPIHLSKATLSFGTALNNNFIISRNNLDYSITTIIVSVLHSLLIANSALGPLFYFIFIQDFRNAFKKLCLCQSKAGAQENLMKNVCFKNNAVEFSEGNFEAELNNITEK